MFQNAKVIGKSVNPETYHAKEFPRGHVDYMVSSSMLRLFLQCPSRWRAGYESPESDAKKFGSLLDTRLLVPEQFSDRFSIKPSTYPAEGKKKGDPIEDKPWNGNANFCREWVEKQGSKQIVSASEIAEVDTARERMMTDETIKEWFDSCDKQVWVKAEWKDKTTGLIIPLQILLDFVPRIDTPFMKALGDLKAVRSAALRPFSRQVFQLGWHTQAAMYQDVYCAATGEDRVDFMFICQENYAPFETGRRMLSQEFLEIGRATYRDGLKQYARCLKTGVWPSYDLPEQFSLVSPEPFMEYEALSSAIEADQAAALEESGDIIP